MFRSYLALVLCCTSAMGPAITSDAATSARERQLLTTASLSPHNVDENSHYNLEMDATSNSLTRSCMDVIDASTEGSQAAMDKLDSTSQKLDGLLPSNNTNSSTSVLNLVNLKEVENRRQVGIFIKNNSCSTAPNGSVSAVLNRTIGLPAPCRTRLPGNTRLSLRLVNSTNSHPTNPNVPPSTFRHMIILPHTIGQTLNEVPVSAPSISVPMETNCSVGDESDQNTARNLESVQVNGDVDDVNEVIVRQKKLNSRLQQILKRLRRLQCREANSSAKQKLIGLKSSLSQKYGINTATVQPSTSKSTNNESLKNRDIKSLSTAELVSLVQKIQSSQQNTTTSLTSQNKVESSEVKPRLDLVTANELRRVSGHLRSNLQHLEFGIDSDATESSSGEESERECGNVEENNLNESIILSRRKLSVLEWAKDRAEIVSRWTWLQAQVSDLEYRIRQQTEAYKRIKASKGSVILKDCSTKTASESCEKNDFLSKGTKRPLDMIDDIQLPTTSNPDITVPNNMDSSKPSFSSTNGGYDNLTVDEKLKLDAAVPVDPTCRAARCMALHSFQRRTVLRSLGLHQGAKKAAQLSSVRCSCYSPITPCMLCTGRYNNVMKPESQTKQQERISLLDPSYHPVLSFPQDVPLAVRLNDWPRPTLADNSSNSSAQVDQPSTSGLNRSQSNDAVPQPLTIKIRSNHWTSGPVEPESSSEDAGLHMSVDPAVDRQYRVTTSRGRRPAIDAMRRKKHFSSRARSRMSKSVALNSNRGHLLRRRQPGSSLKDALKRQYSRTTYDINNVVLSTSQSSARLEILQYKEIITPKWREVINLSRRGKKTISEAEIGKKPTFTVSEPVPSIVEQSKSVVNCSSGAESNLEEEVEDLSDETYMARHLRYEIYEKKQILPTAGQQRRSRSNRSESDSFMTPINPHSPDSGQLEFSHHVGHGLSASLGSGDAIDEQWRHHVEFFPSNRQHVNVNIRRSSSSSSCAAGLATSQSYDSLRGEMSNNVDFQSYKSWPVRHFPLADDETEQLFRDTPPMVRTDNPDRRKSVCPSSPTPSSVESEETSALMEEDPDDPEWTIAQPKDSKSGLLIKISKL